MDRLHIWRLNRFHSILIGAPSSSLAEGCYDFITSLIRVINSNNRKIEHERCQAGAWRTNRESRIAHSISNKTFLIIFLLCTFAWRLYADDIAWRPAVRDTALQEYYLMLISVAEEEGRFDDARAFTRIALDNDPQSSDLRLKLAEYYYWNAEYDLASPLYNKVYLDTGDKEALLRFGDSENLAGRTDRAESIYRQAYRTFDDEESFESWYSMVSRYRSPYRAISIIKSYIEYHPDSTGWQSELGELYIDVNKPYAAIDALQKAALEEVDIVSLLMIDNLRQYLRSNIYAAADYTEDRTKHWLYYYRRFFVFADRRLTDYLYVQMNYLYDQVRRDSRSGYVMGDSKRRNQFMETELALLARYDLILSGSMQFDLDREKSAGWNVSVDYTPEHMDIELSYDDTVIEYWDNRRREHLGLSVEYDMASWTIGNSFHGYRMRDDEVFVDADPEVVPYGIEIVERENRGFSDRLSFANRVYNAPDISVGGFFTAKSYRYESRFYYSPDEIYLFGATAAFHHAIDRFELDIDWELGLDSETGRYSAFTGSLKTNFALGSFKLAFDYLRDTDNRQIGFSLVFSDFKL